MIPKDFTIGTEFNCGGLRWRCTDIGTRTIVAIALDRNDDPSWYNGPPYAVHEHVFNENCLDGITWTDDRIHLKCPTALLFGAADAMMPTRT